MFRYSMKSWSKGDTEIEPSSIWKRQTVSSYAEKKYLPVSLDPSRFFVSLAHIGVVEF